MLKVYTPNIPSVQKIFPNFQKIFLEFSKFSVFRSEKGQYNQKRRPKEYIQKNIEKQSVDRLFIFRPKNFHTFDLLHSMYF